MKKLIIPIAAVVSGLFLGFLSIPFFSFASTSTDAGASQLEIQTLSPASGGQGIPVTIIGTNFGSSQEAMWGWNYVRFGADINTDITSWPTGSEIHIMTPSLEDAENDSSAALDLEQISNPTGLFPPVSIPVLGLVTYFTGAISYQLTQPSGNAQGTPIDVTIVTAFAGTKESNPKVFTYVTPPIKNIGDVVNLVANSFGSTVKLLSNLSGVTDLYTYFIAQPPSTSLSQRFLDFEQHNIATMARGTTEAVVRGEDLITNSAQTTNSNTSSNLSTVHPLENIVKSQATQNNGAGSSNPTSPVSEQNSNTLTVQLFDQYGIPVTSLVEKGSFAYAYMPSMYLLDSSGNEVPGDFCRQEGCGYGLQQGDSDGIWDFSNDIPYGNYTIVFTSGECCSSSGTISRSWDAFTKQITISNNSDRFVKATVQTEAVKIPLYFNVNTVDQSGTPIDLGAESMPVFGCYLTDTSGNIVSGLSPLGGNTCANLYGLYSEPLASGSYIFHLDVNGYQPFEKTFNVPDVSSMTNAQVESEHIGTMDWGNITLQTQ